MQMQSYHGITVLQSAQFGKQADVSMCQCLDILDITVCSTCNFCAETYAMLAGRSARKLIVLNFLRSSLQGIQ